MPQIEVTFDIDANGILHVSAKDKATGKENKITIKANSGLSEDEIQRMVKDAEAHAEEDRKLMEVVQARNSLDGLVHSVKKSLADYGDKVGADEKGKIEAALKDAEELLKDKDAGKDALEAKSEALATASQKLGEAMYAQAQAAQGGAGAGAGQGPSGAGEGPKGGDEKVVDAEYTEVKDRK
jgi:molecular chaperone DnaK